MRCHAKGPLLVLVLCATATHIAQTQEKQTGSAGTYRAPRATSVRQQKLSAFRLLTPDEGLAILGAALDSRHHHADYSADCSHFVHGLYELAGFDYEYASSYDLYQGSAGFRQVSSPQPGDLAVWRGHAGIVVNPDQRTFFSVLRSGPGVDSYDSPYWKQRGRPRFFRYLKPPPVGGAHSIQSANWQPAVLNEAEPESARSRLPGISEAYSARTASSAQIDGDSPGNSELPRVVVLTSARPKSDQVSAAFLQACTDSESILRRRNLFKFSQSLVAFDHFEVKKVHIKGNQGWVEVQMDELASLNGGKATVGGRLQNEQWSLTRVNNKTWKLTPSRNDVYVPRHIAERILAYKLAQLTEDSSDNASGTQEKGTLARLLNALFEE